MLGTWWRVGLIRLLYLRFQHMAIHWDVSECLAAPSFHCLKIGAGTWGNLQPPNKILDGHQQKIFMLGMGKVKFTGVLWNMWFFPFVNNLPCTGGLKKNWFVPSTNLWVYPNRESYNKKTPEKKTRPHAEIAKRSCRQFLKSRSPAQKQVALGGFKLCRIGFPGVFLGKQKVGAEIVVNRVGEMTQKYLPIFNDKLGETGPLWVITPFFIGVIL